MKKLFLSCLLSALCLTTAFSANYSGTCGDNLTWDLTDGVLTIGGTGAMYDYDILKSTSRAPWYAIRSSIQEISIGDSVTSIGSGAFYKCTSLASITIPNCVTSIGNYAFRDCTGLTSVTIGNSVTNIRNGVFQNCTNLTSITIPNSVTSIEGSAFNGCSGLTSPVCNEYIFAFLPRSYSGAYVIPNGIEIVASDAFYNCSGLTSVTIPNSVTSIGNSAFSGCSSLTSVTIPNSVTSIGNSAFSGCSSLTSPIYNTHIFVFMPTSYSGEYIISDGINSIAGNAFRGCSGLTSVTIPNSVTSIEYNAFYGCSGLTSVTIPNSVTSIGEWAFSHCSSLTSVTIPNSVTSIEGSAFNGCSGLTSVTIPNSVTSIGVSAFSGCSSLTSVTIPNSVTSIEGSAFNGCSGLRKIIFGESLTSLGSNLLKGCSKLDTIVWNAKNFKISSSTDNPFYDGDNYSPNWDVRSQIKSFILGPNVDTIPAYLCCGMTGISSIIIPNSVTSIGYEAFRDCTGLTSVTIGNSVTSIGDRAFWGCSGLTSVTIGNSVTSIGDDAFYKCTGLTSVTIPNSVTSIGNYAFQSCSGLTSVTIPNSVTSIGNYAFWGCTGLTSITCEAVTPPTLNSSVFNEVDKSIPLYVPAGSVSAYQSANQWKDFTNILPIEETPGTCITASGTCGAQGDNLTWELSCDSILTISGTGEMANYHNVSSVPWYSYNSSIQYVVIGNNVTSIGMSAFRDCTDLTSVTIPNSVTSIGIEAFRDCTGLTAVHISDLNAWCKIQFPQSYSSPLYYAHNLYLNGELVTNLVIPEGVTSIGGRAFYGCTSLTSVTIPNSVTSIGNYAFYNCTSLTSVTIPNSVTSIGDDAFSSCTGMTSVTIPNSVTSIGGSAFSGCTGLTSVNITDIAAWCNIAFITYDSNPLYSAKHLYVNNVEVTNLVIPEGVTSIGGRAFYGCTSLTSVTIPNSVTSIGNYAFFGCSGLTSVTIPNSVTSIGESAFQNCRAITEVTIGSGLIALGKSVFNKCTAIELVHWNAINYRQQKPNQDSNCFPFYSSKDNISTFVFGDSLTYIPAYLTKDYTALDTIIIPASVTEIGDYAFANNAKLIICQAETPPTLLGGNIFRTYQAYPTIYVPCGTLKAYQSAWSTYASMIRYANPMYSITVDVNIAEAGTVTYPTNTCADAEDKIISATPNYGYHFVQWSDGGTNNPRSIVLTQDTTFTAEFAIDKTGTCGDDNALTWTYDAETKTLTITGNGTLNSNYYFGIEAPTQMQKLVIGNEITSIGDSAFYKMSTINHLIIGGSVATIGNYAFAECRNFDDITCLANVVPVINETTFANVGNKQYIYLFVPEARERAYHRDTYWGEFDIQVQQAEETTVTTNDVTVDPQDNAATVTWPTNDNAATYTIQITKDGVLFCTLIFNANGQLTGISFAPSRDGQAHAPQAVMTAKGMQFTVTGLNSATHYNYTLQTKDANDNILASYSGEFTTTGVATAIDNIDSSSLQGGDRGRLIYRNGQILILRGDKTYTLQGQEVK